MKQFVYKVYDNSGNFITTWNDVVSFPQFNSYINTGPSEMNVSLARPFNQFGEGDDVAADNRIDVYVKDKDTPSEEKLYSGFISAYSPRITGPQEIIDVTLLSNASRLTFDLVTVSGGQTTQANFYSEDPSNIAKQLLDEFTTTASGTVDYDTSSISITGTSVTYAFNAITYFDALTKVIELTPENWFWRVDANNTYHLKRTSDTADHVLTIGKEIEDINVFKNSEKVANVVQFTGGELDDGSILYKEYANVSSIERYGRRVVQLQDGRVTLEDTAEIIANKILNSRALLDVRVSLVVIDNNNNDYGYDIESFKVGDTIRIEEPNKNIVGSKWDISRHDVDKWDFSQEYILATPLQIQSISYQPDKVTIELSSRPPEVSKRIEDLKRNFTNYINRNVEGSPTS